LVTKYGIDPVHFGLVFIIAATIGNYTPPVGAAMFVACQVLRCPISEYTRDSTPFLIAVTVVTLILIFVPSVVLLVPDMIFGSDLR
jgi:TRAP-type transport system large permease protein